MFSLEKTRFRDDLIVAFQDMERACKKDGEGLFTSTCGDRTRENGPKLKERRCRLDIRMELFTQRVVRPWNSLGRGVVGLHPWMCSRPGGMEL